ncbi:hypothetical protein FB451DRAFT_1460987 [Mycena latifolia]|nr:hypothetical protein FB451DRAFT_1460987 [Mycena latifolia]
MDLTQPYSRGSLDELTYSRQFATPVPHKPPTSSKCKYKPMYPGPTHKDWKKTDLVDFTRLGWEHAPMKMDSRRETKKYHATGEYGGRLLQHTGAEKLREPDSHRQCPPAEIVYTRTLYMGSGLAMDSPRDRKRWIPLSEGDSNRTNKDQLCASDSVELRSASEGACTIPKIDTGRLLDLFSRDSLGLDPTASQDPDIISFVIESISSGGSFRIGRASPTSEIIEWFGLRWRSCGIGMSTLGSPWNSPTEPLNPPTKRKTHPASMAPTRASQSNARLHVYQAQPLLEPIDQGLKDENIFDGRKHCTISSQYQVKADKLAALKAVFEWYRLDLRLTLLENSTDLLVIAAAAEVAVDLQWPVDGDLSEPLVRLRGRFLACFFVSETGYTIHPGKAPRALGTRISLDRVRAGMASRAITADEDWTLEVINHIRRAESAELLNVVWLLQGTPDVSVGSDAGVAGALKWALDVIPSLPLKTDDKLARFLPGFHPAATAIPHMDAARFADYVFCLDTFLTPVTSRDMGLMDKSSIKDALMCQLFDSLSTKLAGRQITIPLLTNILETTARLSRTFENTEWYSGRMPHNPRARERRRHSRRAGVVHLALERAQEQPPKGDEPEGCEWDTHTEVAGLLQALLYHPGDQTKDLPLVSLRAILHALSLPGPTAHTAFLLLKCEEY